MGDYTNYARDLKTHLQEHFVTVNHERPELSVIILAKSKKNLLEHCLINLIKQSYKDFEIIILDDSNSEFLYDAANILSCDTRINYVNCKKENIECSEDEAITIAKTDKIIIIKDNEYLEPDCIKKLVSNGEITELPNINYYYKGVVKQKPSQIQLPADLSYNICIACDDNYAKYAGVTIASILANAADKDNLSIYILDGGISSTHKNEIQSLKYIRDCNITFVPIDNKIFDSYKKVRIPKHISIATFYRLKLASILPEIDKIIYMDCDVIVNTTLKNLYNTDLENYYIAGVQDIGKKILKKNSNYVNAGILVMNLSKIRKDNLENYFLKYTAENINDIKYGDQDIINNVCRGSVKLIDESWNVQSSNFTNRSSYTHNPKIIHFIANKKPWHYGSFSFHKNYYFKYLQLTPWKLNDKELIHWTKDNQRISLLEYFKYRPLFMFRPRFYKALYYTYFKHNK